MTNPSGAVAGNAQNVPQAHTPRTRSKFPLHYHFFNTHRFGDLIPHYVAEMNKDEVFPIHSASDLRSYTLDSPLMQKVTRNKDYFLVPMESILPLNWEKFFDNPVRGDDVLDDVGPTVENFWSKVAQSCSGLVTAHSTLINDSSQTDATVLLATLRLLVILEYFYSNGSLLSSLGCHGSPYSSFVKNGVQSSCDSFFDDVVTTIVTSMGTGRFTFMVDGYTYNVSNAVTTSIPGYSEISIRHALQLMRDNPTFRITSVNAFTNLRTSLVSTFSDYSITFVQSNIPNNLSRLWAYQLCCAHYMTNDHVDYVYSAELFRQLIGNYLNSIYGNTFATGMFFTRNGIKYQYDYLSAHACAYVLNYIQYTSANNILTHPTAASVLAFLGYVSALFGYRRSLRYLDYFTGSRTQPLAVASSTMNTNVSVNANQVSVLDITRSIQAQRFLNSVNRVRHNFEGYLKGIFGGSVPAPDYHNPFYIAHTSDVIFGQETENTGADQFSREIAITTNLRGHSNNFIFEVKSDRPCVAIGISSYEIARVYAKSIDRPFFHLNRFDWFNPFMQYIGDQPIYINETGIYPATSLQTFSYTLRHMEYKQRFNIASGGFVENLPGWLFLASDLRGDQRTLNPDWIRSLNSEFDRFYVSLTGYSLGSYFHFIVDDYNSCEGSRPMAFAPTIL